MKLNPHIQRLVILPEEIKTLLMGATTLVDLDDPASLTKEEAFFDACNRYDAETEFFNSEHNYYSGVLPDSRISKHLKPYYDWLATIFPNHIVFRSQVVRNISGRVVRPHIDPRLYHKLSHRIHAVLATNDRCGHVYFDEDNNYEMAVMNMEAGYLYDFDNITPHSAFNLGDTDRIHIITDYIPLSDIDNHLSVLKDNPNHIEPGVFDTYYRHVRGIKARYGDDNGLRETYLKHLDSK